MGNIERALAWFCVLTIIVSVFALGFFIVGEFQTTQGTVTKKYYDDPDLVCSKGCVTTDECWAVEVSGEGWWNDRACVSESEYDSISVGDYFTED